MTRPAINREMQRITFIWEAMSYLGQIKGANLTSFFHAFLKVDTFS